MKLHRLAPWLFSAMMIPWLAPATAEVQAIKSPPPAGTFQLRPELQGVHPRLHFTSSDIPSYINVAHDHPDQNHFLIWAHGKMLTDDDGYPKSPDAPTPSSFRTNPQSSLPLLRASVSLWCKSLAPQSASS